MRSIAHGGVDIVRYHDNARIVTEVYELYKIIHLVCRDGVKPRYRLIEQQKLFRCAHSACEQDALLLTAGELKVAAVGYIIYSEALHIRR